MSIIKYNKFLKEDEQQSNPVNPAEPVQTQTEIKPVLNKPVSNYWYKMAGKTIRENVNKKDPNTV
jgi:hypothetical protein